MALQECGTIRILFAAAVSAVGKLFGIRGWFYKVAGYKARSIDGPCDYTLPPYNEYVVLGPADPDKVAKEISDRMGAPVAITDINDLEGQILGTSSPDMDRDWLCKILKDNPLGQSTQQTPMGLILQGGGGAAPPGSPESREPFCRRGVPGNPRRHARPCGGLRRIMQKQKASCPYGSGMPSFIGPISGRGRRDAPKGPAG